MEIIIMADQELKKIKYQEHVDAIEAHKTLLDKQGMDSNISLDDIKNSLNSLVLTFDEYMKIIGIP
jgi:hypothetical protein